MNSEVFILSEIQPNASHWTANYFKVKKCKIKQWPSCSPNLNLNKNAFHLLKAKHHKNKQKLKTDTVMAWQSITREAQRLVMFMGSSFQAVISCKGFETKY